jgi:hypothetical protein
MATPGFTELFPLFAIAVLSAFVLIWPAARICRRIGFSPWLGVLAVGPVANVVLLWFVAVAQWPKSPSDQRGG